MAATSLQGSSQASRSAAETDQADGLSPRTVEDPDKLSRHVYGPRMIGAAGEFVWEQIFEFQESTGRTESAVWREVVREDADVHAMGCQKQTTDRERGKDTAYRGFIDATAGAIREQTTTRGHGFDVVHAPGEGDWHVHISVRLASGIAKPSKNDKQDIRAAMQEVFGPLQGHNCV